MNGEIATSALTRASYHAVLICAVLTLFRPVLNAKDVRIRVLNGRNGKPVSTECVNVFVEGRKTSIVIPTDRDGVAVLHVGDEQMGTLGADHGQECNGLATPHPTVASADAIELAGDYYVACQEYGKVMPGEPPTDPLKSMPYYSVKRILEAGLTTANTCGKARIEPRPGELIFFVKPRGFLEKLRQ